MGLLLTNLSDGTTQAIATGAIGAVTIQATSTSLQNGARGLYIAWDSSLATIVRAGGGLTTTTGFDVTATINGDIGVAATGFAVKQGDADTGGTGSFQHYTPAANLSLTPTTGGDYYVNLSLAGATGVEYCGLVVHVTPAFNLALATAPSWVPTDLADLELDLGTRTVASGVLSRVAGLKQGDDFKLAIVPRLAGTLITSGITAMSLTIIDRPNSPYAPLTFAATGSPPTLTEIGGDPTHQYYSIVGNLRDPSIAQWFADLQTRINALTTTPLPDRGRLCSLAQIHITTADGITTTQNFPFPILATAEVLTGEGAATTTADTGMDLQWDLATNAISIPGAAAPAPGVALIFVKEQDDIIVRLRLVKNGSALAPTVTQCKLVLKELEPDGQIVISDGYATAGTGDNFSLLIHAQFSGALLAGALSNYEADAGTSFAALAEIELTYTNPWFGTVGPASLIRTSKTFPIQIDRDLGEAA